MSTLRVRSRIGALLAGVVALTAAGPSFAGWDELNLTQGVTPVSGQVYDLHMLILWICVIIGVVVFGTMIYSIIRFRKSKGAEAAQFHESTTVEIVWTIIPFLILIGMAIPATGTLVTMENTSKADLSIKITGFQWKWHYQYLDEGVGFYSNLGTPTDQIENRTAKDPNYLREVDNRLVVPTGTRIRFLLTAGDVIHAWWIPELGMKKDAIPGKVNAMWTKIEEPGVYRGQCAELCGRGHAFMPIVVEAKPPEEFRRWLQRKKTAQAESSTQVAKAE